MAKLGEIEIANKDADFSSGAAFKLSKKPSGSRVVKLKSGWDIETQLGNPYVVARGNTDTEESLTFKSAYEATQEGLDILCAGGVDSLAVIDSSKEYFIWWRRNTEQLLKIVSTDHRALSSGSDVKVINVSADVTSLPTSPTVVYHESFRYFRLSQVTDDLFDAFRNLWLALESLLDHKYPKRDREGEKAWLKRSLTELHNEFDLSELVDGGADTVKNLLSIYEGTRNRLFHAKRSKKSLTPQNADDRAKVVKGSEELARLVVLLFNRLFRVSRSGLRVHHIVHREVTRQTMEDCRFFLSDYDELLYTEGPFEDVVMEDDIANKIEMEHNFSDELSEPYLEQILAVVDSSRLQSISPLKSFIVCKQGQMIFFHGFEVEVTPSFVDKFEVQFGQRLFMKSQPKAFYKL